MRKEISHEIINGNGVRVVNFATFKNLKSKFECSHISIFINIGTSKLGKTQILTISLEVCSFGKL
jgi:hypothetical protein